MNIGLMNIPQSEFIYKYIYIYIYMYSYTIQLLTMLHLIVKYLN